jgi:hypothetical protein
MQKFRERKYSAMAVLKTEPCSVCGSESCPCILATIKECIVCHHLQANKEMCDCDWQKVCIYLNFRHNKTAVPEVSSLMRVVPLRCLNRGEDIFQLYLAISPEMMNRIHPLEKVYFCSTFYAKRYRLAAVVLQKYPEQQVACLGIKASFLDERLLLSNHLSYHLEHTGKSTVLGLSSLVKITNGKILVVAEGLGELMVPALAQQIMENNSNFLSIALAKGHPILNSKIADLGAELIICGSNTAKAFQSAAAKGINYCCSLGSIDLHKKVLQAFLKYKLFMPLAATLFD